MSASAASSALVAAAFVVAPLAGADTKVPEAERLSFLRRAQVWRPTDVPAMDMRKGPPLKGAFAPDELVRCDYVAKKLSGRTPKFSCVIDGHDEVKVKFGNDNGEVYAEVAATRLLWALGFGADGQYPVRVACRGCPAILGGQANGDQRARLFDPAMIERKMPGREITTDKSEGWSWSELFFEVNEAVGGAPLAHRQALGLLAAMLQHSDSKEEQQRLLCVPGSKISDDEDPRCPRPFLMVHDVGVTFGTANAMNLSELGSANYERWTKTRVWKGDSGCVANMGKSSTGTLDNPVIGEAGRAFLAGLLAQLTDRQLADMFEVAHFDRRSRDPAPNLRETPPPATIAEWVSAFKQKRAEIAGRTCGS